MHACMYVCGLRGGSCEFGKRVQISFISLLLSKSHIAHDDSIQKWQTKGDEHEKKKIH